MYHFLASMEILNISKSRKHKIATLHWICHGWSHYVIYKVGYNVWPKSFNLQVMCLRPYKFAGYAHYHLHHVHADDFINLNHV